MSKLDAIAARISNINKADFFLNSTHFSCPSVFLLILRKRPDRARPGLVRPLVSFTRNYIWSEQFRASDFSFSNLSISGTRAFASCFLAKLRIYRQTSMTCASEQTLSSEQTPLVWEERGEDRSDVDCYRDHKLRCCWSNCGYEWVDHANKV